MNENEIDRIAHAINVLRPDWPVSSLRTLLQRPALASKPRRDVIVALGWVASEAATTTPARVLEAGPWWQAAAIENRSVVRYPPERGEDCPQHPGEWPDSCRGCASERLAPVVDIRPDMRPVDASHVRAQLRLATSNLCSHGVEPDHCLQKHETEEETAAYHAKAQKLADERAALKKQPGGDPA